MNYMSSCAQRLISHLLKGRFFSSEYDHTLYRMAWMASNKQCEVTLGCHEQPFLLLISRIGEDMRRIHIPVLPEELAHFGLLERLENHTPSKLNVIQFYYVQSDYIQALKMPNSQFINARMCRMWTIKPIPSSSWVLHFPKRHIDMQSRYPARMQLGLAISQSWSQETYRRRKGRCAYRT